MPLRLPQDTYSGGIPNNTGKGIQTMKKRVVITGYSVINDMGKTETA